MKTYVYLFSLTCALILALMIAKLVSSNDSPPPSPLTEEYDPVLYKKIRNVSDLLTYVDTMSKIEDKTSLGYAEALSVTIRKRFFHNYSFYGFSENWGAAVAGKLVWSDLGAIVIADDMLKYPMAACSQQSLVLLTCFQRLGVPYRAVRFAHHFAAEGMFDGKWYYFDTDKEPHFPHGRKSTEELLKTGEFYTAYKAEAGTPAEMEWWVGTKEGYPRYDPVSILPAPRARLFQHITKFFSFDGLFIVALFLLWRIVRLKRREGKSYQPQTTWFWQKKPKAELS